MNAMTRQPVKPVHPKPALTHGLIGVPYARQHWMLDNRWTASSISEQFKLMGDLIAKRNVFLKLEMDAGHKTSVREYQKLQKDCRDGRAKLRLFLYGDNQYKVHNYLLNHRDMQRLYTKMPLHLVIENINQRTFVMRKERDRLRYALKKLTTEYEDKLIQAGELQNRIKYQHEFILEEEVKSCYFRRKIADSYVRLKGIKTVNSAYNKMLQVLRHDEIFHDPILNSLSQDLADQEAFIKYILYTGMPAVSAFNVLSEDYRKMFEKERKIMQTLQQYINSKRTNPHGSTGDVVAKQKSVKPVVNLEIALRYVRNTPDMKALKDELELVTNTIRDIQFTTLCSQARDIYPRIKSQLENNVKLKKMIENDKLVHHHLNNKEQKAELMEGLLVNDLTKEEIKRLETIEKLKEDISNEDKFEAKTLEHIKNRGDCFVLLRFSLWNLHDILRHIDQKDRASLLYTYQSSYLQLPLLKFHMLTMHACPPEIFNEDLDTTMHFIKRKLRKLMKAFEGVSSAANIESCYEEYHRGFLASTAVNEEAGGEVEAQKKKGKEEEEEQLQTRVLQKIPDYASIKALSQKLVEEFMKKED